MQFIKPDVNIDFIGVRKIGYMVTLAMILVTIGTLIIHGGPRYGIDFSGGTVIQVRFDKPISINAVKAGLAAANIENGEAA